MKITLFTGNQPRHVALMESLCEIAESVFVVQECNTVFPGQVEDFHKKSEVMRDYFARVIAAEESVFGKSRFGPSNARQLAIKTGDLNRLSPDVLRPALESDVYVVFGASFIKPPLVDVLVEKRAYNIHMGVSPQYRGNACNFWALQDRRPEFVGATIHLLSKGLDSGPMLFHTLPKPQEVDGFTLGMLAVKAAHRGLIEHLKAGDLATMPAVTQDKSKQIRYTRNADFTDDAASAYLKSLPSSAEIHAALQKRDLNAFQKPFLF